MIKCNTGSKIIQKWLVKLKTNFTYILLGTRILNFNVHYLLFLLVTTVFFTA